MLNIRTYDPIHGNSCFFKALGHPYGREKLKSLVNTLKAFPSISIFDPEGHFNDFMALTGLPFSHISQLFVQALEKRHQLFGPLKSKMISELYQCPVEILLILSFDGARILKQLDLPPNLEVVTLEELLLPDWMIGNRNRYLSELNFATNFAFFRDCRGSHTRLVSLNYWHRYRAHQVRLWCCLFDEQGTVLADWQQELAEGERSLVIDSQEVKQRFQLGDFTGQLFIHIIGAQGHDTVKYALDIYNDEGSLLSSTHDANAWPADYFAGLPAPEAQGKVILWLQNAHPLTIPPHTIGLSYMGGTEVRTVAAAIPPFGTYGLDIAQLFPESQWPQQLEIHAGRYFMRPRYEVLNQEQHQHIAHVNVERTDLRPDPMLANLQEELGKGFIVSAPILPVKYYHSYVLPTPMARSQQFLPIKAIVYNPLGEELLSHQFGRLPRSHSQLLAVSELLPSSASGHVELVYDFQQGNEADGWLHAIFRYQHKHSGAQAETSFGSHIFNNFLTYRNEPQSYSGPPPGLTTRLFLRLGPEPLATFCQLIYPVSKKWHPFSCTTITLYNNLGLQIAERSVQIPASGSYFWYYTELFTAEERSRLTDPYIMVTDRTCRLFGYHGLVNSAQVFSLDHMFGF